MGLKPFDLRSRCLASLLWLVVPLVGLGACQTTVASLAEGDGPLAKDAQAVLKALAKSGVPNKWIRLLPDGLLTKNTCPPHPMSCAGVAVRGQRIVGVFGRGVEGLDLAALNAVSELENVRVQYSKLGRLEGLQGLKKLKQLDLMASDCVRLANLRRLPQLHTLKHGCSSLREVEGLEDLPKLDELSLSGRHIVSIRGLKNLGLREIDVAKSKLEVLEGLTGLPELTSIRVAGNKLKRLVLSNLPKLSHVWARKNAIASVELSQLPALRTLDLSDNQLVALPKVVGTLPVLDDLRVSGNKIATLGGLETVPALTVLHVERNVLTSLTGIERATKLKTLHVSHNKLTTLAPLVPSKLEELIATHNALADATELFGKDKKTRPKLASYDLRQNKLEGVAPALLLFGLERSLGPSTSSGNVNMGIGGTPRRLSVPSASPTGSPTAVRPIRSTSGRYSGGSGGYRPGK